MHDLPNLTASAQRLGKPAWRVMLEYVARLHAKSIRPARFPFPYDWEEIGPGYWLGPAFGRWDIVHAVLDTLPSEPEHAQRHLLNYLATQQPDGRMPTVIWMREGQPSWSTTTTQPPVWPVALQAHADHTSSLELIATGLDHLIRQIGWFEAHRQAEPFGFYYADVVHGGWESGVDEGIRLPDVQPSPRACIDATTHVYALYEYAARWAETLGQASAGWQKKAGALRAFIQYELFDDETGFIYDAWSVRDRPNRSTSYEGMWPVVLGAATAEQAARVIGDHLLSPQRFLASHPITSVTQEDRHFELRMWRGPAWNSMTYWAATGCQRYGALAAASLLLESALDDSAKQFAQTGTIWEFYHPHGGQPTELLRKPHTPFNVPCRDYLGHNPLLAMAALFEETTPSLS